MYPLHDILGVGFIITIVIAVSFIGYHSWKKNVKAKRQEAIDWEQENSQW